MEHTVHFENPQGEKLAGTLHEPATPADKGVVIGHCFTCSRHTRVLRRVAVNLSEAGFATLRFDFSGNGQSQGRFADSGYSKHILEMKRAVEFMSARGADWVGLAGHSMGAAIAVLATTKIPSVKAVCALAGRLSSTDAMHFLDRKQKETLARNGRVAFISRGRTLELTRAFFADARHFDLSHQIAALKLPLLVVHGERDEIVPVQEAYQAHSLNPKRIDLAIIPESDHMFSLKAHRHQVAEMTTEWFIKQAANGLPAR